MAAGLESLDPIEVAHSFRYEKLTHLRPFGYEAIRMLTSGEYFRSSILDPKRTGIASRPTARAYAAHLEELTRVRVLQLVARAEVNPTTWAIICGYFAVTKPGKSGARSILNGRPVSSRCHIPPCVNLADVTDVIAYYKAYRGRPAFAVMDFRHYFHQIGLSREVYEHFRIRCGEKEYLWTTLPMGWSYSPYLAQALSWCVIIQAVESLGLSHSVPFDAQMLPTSIKIRRADEEAEVFLTYDNVAIIGNGYITSAVHAAIQRTCTSLGLVIKEGSEVSLSHKQMDFDAEVEAIHLGVRFGTVCRRRAICIAPAAIARWSEVLNQFRSASTCSRRLAARCAGIVLHRARVYEHPLWKEKELINIIRRLAREKGSWDASFELTVPERSLLTTRMQEVVDNKPHLFGGRATHKTGEVIVVAADASDDHGGYVIIDKSGAPREVKDFDLQRAEHIFIKEMRAAEQGIKAALSLLSNQKGATIHLLEDNSAVGYALKKGLTASAIAQPVLEAIMTSINEAEANLVVHIIPGIVNPADEPSRRKPIDSLKTAQWAGLYQRDFYMPFFKHDDDYKGSSRLRHAEPEERDEEEVEVVCQLDQWMSYGTGEEDPADPLTGQELA